MEWKVLMLVEIVLVVLTAVAEVAAAPAAADTLLPRCKDKCGNISIPYPFGIGVGCFRRGFELGCNDTSNPPKLFVDTEAIEVAGIFPSGHLRIKVEVGGECYNRNGVKNGTTFTQWINLNSRPFTFSHTMNKFTAVGCDTVALIGGTMGAFFRGGCLSYCGTSPEGLVNGTCSGIGCCQVSIPRGLKNFITSLGSTYNYTQSWWFNRCGHGFLAEEGQYRFSTADLSDTAFSRPFPIMLDWSIGNQTCKQVAQSNRPSDDYACRSEHSECVDSPNGVGYLCNCSAGYKGNPYLDGGCQGTDTHARGTAKTHRPGTTPARALRAAVPQIRLENDASQILKGHRRSRCV